MDERPDRLTALLAKRAVECLDAAEDRELRALLAQRPDVDPAAFDRAAAAVALAFLDTCEPLPARLRAAIERDAAECFRR